MALPAPRLHGYTPCPCKCTSCVQLGLRRLMAAVGLSKVVCRSAQWVKSMCMHQTRVLQASDIDRLDHLARDCEALTKELSAARSHLAKSEKDKHQVCFFVTAGTVSPAVCRYLTHTVRP